MDHDHFNPTQTAALYVAEVLEEPLFGDFRRHLDDCSTCAQEVAYWNRGVDAFESIRQFIARRHARRHFRWVLALTGLAFFSGLLAGAAALDAYLRLRPG